MCRKVLLLWGRIDLAGDQLEFKSIYLAFREQPKGVPAPVFVKLKSSFVPKRVQTPKSSIFSINIDFHVRPTSSTTRSVRRKLTFRILARHYFSIKHKQPSHVLMQDVCTHNHNFSSTTLIILLDSSFTGGKTIRTFFYFKTSTTLSSITMVRHFNLKQNN
jgi:hypothetical protein